MEFEGLAAGWKVWNATERKAVLAYRPDVFDTDAFPAPCLPTIYVTKGRRSRRPGKDVPDPEDPWYVTLYLEPEVTGEESRFDSRDSAVAGAEKIAQQFHQGEIDYRSMYQVPREAYFDRLDELTGRE